MLFPFYRLRDSEGVTKLYSITLSESSYVLSITLWATQVPRMVEDGPVIAINLALLDMEGQGYGWTVVRQLDEMKQALDIKSIRYFTIWDPPQ